LENVVPELPEVEVLVRHLLPLVRGKVIRGLTVSRARVVRPAPISNFIRELKHARFENLSRRGKFLLFTLTRPKPARTILLIGHLGMTGRMYLLPKSVALPKHTSVSMDLDSQRFVFEDTRFFGRLTLETGVIERLGPEPLSSEFTIEKLADGLRRSAQPIKIKLLDQTLIAGVGNIYASEALFRSGISPRTPARQLNHIQVSKLWSAIRHVLAEAIERGSSLPLNYANDSSAGAKSFFYFGSFENVDEPEPFSVYGRLGAPCPVCGRPIRRLTQAARSTFYCPRCQGSKLKRKIGPRRQIKV
jgi:formamidopyrimidine-DNA glycosylase